MSKVRVSDYIASRAVAAGARHVFLVTGGGAMHLNDAFHRNRDLTAICFHHEQAAAIAAEGYFRVNNRMAILNVTTGPGAINALNGVFGAYVDSQAMLVVSGQVKRETMVRNQALPLRQLGDQEVDIAGMVGQIVKYIEVLQNPDDARKVLDKAIFLAMEGRPGPVWIDVPIDVQAALIDPDALQGWDHEDLVSLQEDPAVTENTRLSLRYATVGSDTTTIQELLARIHQAKRPVIMAGTGIRSAGMLELFRQVVDKLGIPVVTGWNAHDTLEYDHPCYAGKPGTVGDRAGNFTVQNADLLLVLGCRLNIRQVSYNWKSFATHAWKAMVDIDPAELNKHTLNIDAKICARLQDFIPELVSQLKNHQPLMPHRQFMAWCRQRVEKYPTVLSEYRKSSTVINPYVFVDELFRSLPENAVVVAGNGSACVIGFQASHIRRGQRFFTNSGCASMGYDLPAAIGACLANNRQPVYCLAGDGSLMMNIQDLQTIAGYRLPVKVLVLNNGGYVSIKQTQNAYFPDNLFGTDSKNGVTFPDFVSLAHAFGLPALRVRKLSEWQSLEVRTFLQSDGPGLIDVVVDENQPFSPKLASRKLDDGTMVSPSLEDMAPFLSREEMEQNILW